MSITQIQAIPTGTWSADKVHSNVAFAVDYMAGTFQGSFANFEAEARDGVLTGSARVDSVQVKIPDLAARRPARPVQRGPADRRPPADQAGLVMRVLGISGSLRRASHNTKLLQAAGEMVARRGVEFELYNALKQVPPYDEDDDRDPAPRAAAH